jgi:uncharacterized protein (DUF1697 family)
LRGVNVGGKHKIRMEALRALCESLGLKEPRTFIQSGNIVFGARQPSLVGLGRRIEQAIERSGAKMGNAGSSAAAAALEMANLLRGLAS